MSTTPAQFVCEPKRQSGSALADRTVVVMPAYNEAAHVGPVVREVCAQLPVVVVDDGSTDQTTHVAEQAGATVLRQPVNRGKGRALECGFAYARKQGYTVVITMDADGQHDPRDLDTFLQMHRMRPDAVLIGDRTGGARHMPRLRRWTNRMMSALLSRRMGCQVPDTQCGYRLYPAWALDCGEILATGFAAESEILLRLSRNGVSLLSVPVCTIYSNQHSKIHPWLDTWRFCRMWQQFGR